MQLHEACGLLFRIMLLNAYNKLHDKIHRMLQEHREQLLTQAGGPSTDDI